MHVTVSSSGGFPIRLREHKSGSELLEIVREVAKTTPDFIVKEGFLTGVREDLVSPEGEPFGIEVRTYPQPAGLQKLMCRLFGKEWYIGEGGYDFHHISHSFRFSINPAEQYKQLTCIYNGELYRTHRPTFDYLVQELERRLYFNKPGVAEQI